MADEEEPVPSQQEEEQNQVPANIVDQQQSEEQTALERDNPDERTTENRESNQQNDEVQPHIVQIPTDVQPTTEEQPQNIDQVSNDAVTTDEQQQQQDQIQPVANEDQNTIPGQANVGNDQQSTDNDQQPAANNPQPTADDHPTGANDQQPADNDQQPAVDDQQPANNDQQPTADDQQPAEDDQQPGVDNQQSAEDNQQPTQANDQQPTADDQQPTANDQQPAADDEQPAVNDEQPAANDEQPAANDEQPAANDEQPAANDEQPAANDEQPAANDEQPASNDELPAANDQQPVADDQQPIADDQQPAVDNQQHTVIVNQQAAVNNQQPVDNNQQSGSTDNQQSALDDKQPATDGQPTANNQEPNAPNDQQPRVNNQQSNVDIPQPNANDQQASVDIEQQSAAESQQQQRAELQTQQSLGKVSSAKADTEDIPSLPEDTTSSTNALTLSWSFGVNKNIPVLNLTDEKRTLVMYAMAHCGILYDYRANKQTILRGHSNSITATACSQDKKWLVTADKGPDSFIIVWNTYTGVPVRTIFDAHPDGGTIALAMTPDARYIASISAAKTQTFAVWDWTSEEDVPLSTATLKPEYGVQNFLTFNPEDFSQIVSNSEHQVIFYSWKTDKNSKMQCNYFAPPLSDEDFNKPVGRFSQSIFMSKSTRALTATSFGNLVMWDNNKPITMMKDNESSPDKKALKLVKLQENGLRIITQSDDYIVTGDAVGHVKFYNQKLKLMHWYPDIKIGPINSVSFQYIPDFAFQWPSEESNYPSDASVEGATIMLRNMIVGSSTATLAHLTTDGTKVEIIFNDHDSAVYALDTHPNKPLIAVGSYAGLLKIWNYELKNTITTRQFPHGMLIRCCAFDPRGEYLAVGFTNGAVYVLDSLTLQDSLSEPFCYARDAVTHICFSHNSEYLATADAECTVSVFHATHDPNGDPWDYLGRYRAHYKLINDLLFGVHLDSDLPRLLSLGKDRVLVEFDLENSSRDDLKVSSMDRIEQSATPLCMTWYPEVTKESFIVTSNNQYKFKLYNSTTKMCRRTLLGPTFGNPVQRIVPIIEKPTNEDPKHYLAFVTEDKIGLGILPVSGNPHNNMALIAHPQGTPHKAVNLRSAFDGKFLFTAGGVDCTINMWQINVDVLHAKSRLGGEDLVPFYGLLDGGREGDLFKELEDYFYYSQLRSQGINTQVKRKVSTTIPVSEIPFVMRAMGFYPSEQEIEDMLNEIKYSNYVETGEYTHEINLGDFIKLYINHRPAFGLQMNSISKAFDILGIDVGKGSTIDRGELLDILQNRGETMTEVELAEYLTTLLGFNPEGGTSELEVFNPETAGDIIETNLPVEMNTAVFCDDLLGFSMYTNAVQQADIMTIEQQPTEHCDQSIVSQQ